jgi:hypothetical protein
LLDFIAIQLGRRATENGFEATIFNSIASTTQKWRMLKRLRWTQNLNQSTWDHAILYADTSSKDEPFLLRLFFVKSQKYERGG